MPELFNGHPSNDYWLVVQVDDENWIVKSKSSREIFSVREYNLTCEDENPKYIWNGTRYLMTVFAIYQENNRCWLVMELNYSLHLTLDLKIPMSEETIATIVRDALQGLRDLHSNYRVHRKLRVYQLSLMPSGLVKLCDWELFECKPPAQSANEMEQPYWLAPEIITENDYHYKTDIWSLGITLIELVEGKPPFSDLHPWTAIFRIPKAPPPTFATPEKYSTQMNDFLRLCLQKDPKLRPEASQLLEHDFIKLKAQSSEHLIPLYKAIDTKFPLPLPWNVTKVLWIGHKKEDPMYCNFAKLPREIVAAIIQVAQKEAMKLRTLGLESWKSKPRISDF